MLWGMLLMLQQEVYNSNLDFTFCLNRPSRSATGENLALLKSSLYTVLHLCVTFISLRIHQIFVKLPMEISFSIRSLKTSVRLLAPTHNTVSVINDVKPLLLIVVNKCPKDGAVYRVISESYQVKANSDNGTC